MGKTLLHYVLFSFLFALVLAGFVYASSPVDKKEYVTITVAPGDTLWGLAKQYEQEHHMPPDEFIRWVVDVNHLPSPRLAAGEQIVIPVLKSKHGGSLAVNR
ncbi:cell division suppressor protein YneA [Geobacillus stearothermophilus]|uniref:cell division suppressor protein YneA n=1 Tax=Geobacillus stearothermophilus TaxID=1422 RepID=UPI001363FF7E|nr:cell division suppressor protein YneA [Geobacillus stearothermophilus]WJQ01477.1 cell division suppressor protein YneA [Geobacillus stearothermophilus]WJQ04895.1 cell division suppressor protein YneA [Geobacillus stearothermophilus]